LELREDFFAVAWFHWLHKEAITGKPLPLPPLPHTDEDPTDKEKNEEAEDKATEAEEITEEF